MHFNMGMVPIQAHTHLHRNVSRKGYCENVTGEANIEGSPRQIEDENIPAFHTLTSELGEANICLHHPILMFWALPQGSWVWGTAYFRHTGVATMAAAARGEPSPRIHPLDTSAKMSAIAAPPPGCD